MASSIPTARTNLYTGLQTLTADAQPLDNVGVYRTGLWREVRAHDRVVVLNARNIEQDFASIGKFMFEENYSIPVAVEVNRVGDDVAYVEARLWAIVTEIQKWVVANYTLSGAVKWIKPAGAFDPEQSGPNAADEDALLGMVTLRFDCMARVLLS